MEFHIPTIAPEIIGNIGGWPITNTMINVWLALVLFLILSILCAKLSLRPKGFQNAAEYFLETMLGYFDQVTGDRKKTLRFLPIVGPIFFFILFSNWLGLLPGTGSIKIDGAFLLRPANADMNLTLAMAVFTVVISHVFGFITVGIAAHLGKFVQIANIFKSLRHGPIAIFTALVEALVGLIEIVSELAKVLSLSLRLFGNIFAGEVLISVMAALVGIVVPTPFMLLELLVGIIQASVFSMLALVYMTIAATEPHGAEH